MNGRLRPLGRVLHTTADRLFVDQRRLDGAQTTLGLGPSGMRCLRRFNSSVLLAPDGMEFRTQILDCLLSAHKLSFDVSRAAACDRMAWFAKR
jgi:hypothetical protein